MLRVKSKVSSWGLVSIYRTVQLSIVSDVLSEIFRAGKVAIATLPASVFYFLISIIVGAFGGALYSIAPISGLPALLKP